MKKKLAALGKHVVGIFNWIGSRELTMLLVVFALVGSLWGFAELAEEVMEGDTHEFDRALLMLMRNPADASDPLGPAWFEEMGRDVTALGGNVILTGLALAVIGYLLLERRRRIALVVLMATAGALTMSSLLKHNFDRDRPDLVPHGSVVYTQSFPSGHSMLAASTYLTLGALLARLARRRRIKAYILLIAVTTTVLVGLSRIYLGVHWPTDVLAGWTAGTGWALVCWLFARWLQKRGQIETTDGDTTGIHHG